MLPPEELIHSGPDSPHVKGSIAAWYYGENILLRRENDRLWRALFLTPPLMGVLFFLVLLVL